jgi:hypothetical protein
MLKERILLEPEQVSLLCRLIEAERSVPKGQRGKFIAAGSDQTSSAVFLYTAPGGIRVVGSTTDAEILAEKGLLGLTYSSQGGRLFHITPEALEYYRGLMQASKPTEAVEEKMRSHLSSKHFERSYEAAYQKWSQAEALLWKSDSDKQYTSVGHLCREALQEFADALVSIHTPPNADSDKARTKSRIRAVVELRKNSLCSTERELLDRLVDYWHVVSDLVQRQEHGAQRDGAPLTWEDARRVVFQTLVVMYEVDRSLNKIDS